jgi:hypothetical protein
MKKNLPIFTLAIAALLLTSALITRYYKQPKDLKTALAEVKAAMSVGDGKDKFARFTWEQRRLAAPDGKIPQAMHRRELDFGKQLRQQANAKTDAQNSIDSLEWINRGPYNMGGRTRAFAMDINNSNILLAGGVSGGMFRSTDAGATWNKVTGLDQNQSVTCLVQDKRPSHTNTWYYGTGEAYGNSAGGVGAFYLGDGLYKSTDNGLTWQALGATDNGNQHTFTTNWQLVWNVATDPSNADQEEVYAACYGTIYRSTNGGNTWATEINGGNAYFTNVAVTSTGVVYAAVSSDGSQAGIWRSVDGMTWTAIKPSNFPENYDRVAIGINPSNENEVYFLISNTIGSGKTTYDFRGDPEENSLWRYNYLSDNGSGTGGNWVDLSQNLPIGPHPFDDFIAQGGYDLVVSVKPDQPNTVFIGGTNIYRSTDGFTTPDNVTHIGGYAETTELPLFELYPVQHPDQHVLFFDPQNPNTLYAGNDGGLYKTTDCMAANVQWASLNHGYVTTQFYSIALDHAVSNNTIIGGLQDNGTRYINTANVQQPWTMPFNYDGSYCAMPSGRDYKIMSINGGAIVKVVVGDDGLMAAFERIDPIDANADLYQFINPFIVDPVDNDIMYLSEGYNFWVNTDVSAIPITNTFEKKSTNWFKHNGHIADTSQFISAFAATHLPAHRLYIGTSEKRIYKVENALDPNSPMIDITPTSGFPSTGYVTCLETDPRDGDKILAVFSNYAVYSLYYSVDAGATWVKVAGNLEQYVTGTGNGPSLRSVSILPITADSTAYFLGTSIGLYYTHLLDTLATEWLPIASNTIGSTVVETVETRALDKLIVVGTHGNGVFSANTPIDVVNVAPIDNTATVLQAAFYPNPCTQTNVNLQVQLPQNYASGQLYLHNTAGQLVTTKTWSNLAAGNHNLTVSVADLPKGIYLYQFIGDNKATVNGKLILM